MIGEKLGSYPAIELLAGWVALNVGGAKVKPERLVCVAAVLSVIVFWSGETARTTHPAGIPFPLTVIPGTSVAPSGRDDTVSMLPFVIVPETLFTGSTDSILSA